MFTVATRCEAAIRVLTARHGFRTTGDPIALPDGPRPWPVWREPRP